MPSKLFWSAAEDFLTAAQKTKSDDPWGLGHESRSVTFYLAGHALELVLKAFLRAKGFSIDDLKNKFGHDLEKLLNQAEAQDLAKFTAVSETHRKLVLLLNDSYKPKDLEYYVAGQKMWPNFRLLEEFIGNILTNTKQFCIENAKYHHGKPTAFLWPADLSP